LLDLIIVEVLMSTQMKKCIGVVDGGMLVMEGGHTVTLAGVRVPRVGIPGGSVLRTYLQRYVQDKEISYEEMGRDNMGYPSISASVEGIDLTNLMSQAIKDYGYAA
jgi:hypothetical protein